MCAPSTPSITIIPMRLVWFALSPLPFCRHSIKIASAPIMHRTASKIRLASFVRVGTLNWWVSIIITCAGPMASISAASPPFCRSSHRSLIRMETSYHIKQIFERHDNFMEIDNAIHNTRCLWSRFEIKFTPSMCVCVRARLIASCMSLAV